MTDKVSLASALHFGGFGGVPMPSPSPSPLSSYIACMYYSCDGRFFRTHRNKIPQVVVHIRLCFMFYCIPCSLGWSRRSCVRVCTRSDANSSRACCREISRRPRHVSSCGTLVCSAARTGTCPHVPAHATRVLFHTKRMEKRRLSRMPQLSSVLGTV